MDWFDCSRGTIVAQGDRRDIAVGREEVRLENSHSDGLRAFCLPLHDVSVKT